MTAQVLPAPGNAPAGATIDYVTVIVAGELFGLPIGCVHDVFFTGAITSVPLAPPQVSGLINLRGRIVTALCMRCLLDMPKTELRGTMVACIEHAGESFGLIVDKVGEVLTLPAGECLPVPLNLDPRWARCSSGVHWLEDRLLVVLDVASLLDPTQFQSPPRQAQTQKGTAP